jgi:hypothetical protein
VEQRRVQAFATLTEAELRWGYTKKRTLNTPKIQSSTNILYLFKLYNQQIA